jgi:hypothetical protein
MSHTHERLNRPLLGQGMGRVRSHMTRLLSRREREVKRIVDIPSPREPRGSSVRMLRARTEAAPNAPQLIRILRHPYRLDLGYFKRRRAESRGMVIREARQGFRLELEKLLHSPKRVEVFRPVQTRPRLTHRLRPSIDAWLATSESR